MSNLIFQNWFFRNQVQINRGKAKKWLRSYCLINILCLSRFTTLLRFQTYSQPLTLSTTTFAVYHNTSSWSFEIHMCQLTLFTPPIAEMRCVKNLRAIVVCGFLKWFWKNILKIWKKLWELFGSYLLNSKLAK